MRWQMALYKEMSGKAEDAEDPEKVVKRVQEVSAVLYHIEVVSVQTVRGAPAGASGLSKKLSLKHSRFFCFRPSIHSNQRKWFGTSCCPNSGAGRWWPVSGWRLSTTSQRKDLHPQTIVWWMSCWRLFVFVYRHRAINMFLNAYKRNWLETEGYSFEDKMIDDLSVSYLSLFRRIITRCFL